MPEEFTMEPRAPIMNPAPISNNQPSQTSETPIRVVESRSQPPMATEGKFDINEITDPSSSGTKVPKAPLPNTVEKVQGEDNENNEESQSEVKEEALEKEVETTEEEPKEENLEVAEDNSKDPADPVKDKDLQKDQDKRERDYTGFDDKEKRMLKRLDTWRFNNIAPQWRALKAMAGESVKLTQQLIEKDKLLQNNGVPQQWYEHPEAYALSPEFRRLSTEFNQHQVLEQHNEQQLLNVKAGQPWVAITGFDQQGNPKYSQQYEASNQADIWLQRQLATAASSKAQIEGKVSGLKDNFQNAHKQSSEVIKREIDTYIGKLQDKNLLPQESDEKMFESLLGGSYANHPLAYAFKKMGAVMLQQGRELNKRAASETQARKIEADKKLAGPQASRAPKEPVKLRAGASNGTMLSLKDFLGTDER